MRVDCGITVGFRMGRAIRLFSAMVNSVPIAGTRPGCRFSLNFPLHKVGVVRLASRDITECQATAAPTMPVDRFRQHTRNTFQSIVGVLVYSNNSRRRAAKKMFTATCTFELLKNK